MTKKMSKKGSQPFNSSEFIQISCSTWGKSSDYFTRKVEEGNQLSMHPIYSVLGESKFSLAAPISSSHNAAMALVIGLHAG